MRAWYVPNHSGDYRLESSEEGAGCTLTTEDLTPEEVHKVTELLSVANDKGWTETKSVVAKGRNTIEFSAPVADVGVVLARKALPNRGVLTAVKSVRGTLMAIVDESEATPSGAFEAVKKEEADAAVTVRRATPCCPDPVPTDGPLKLSSRVLREFCTKQQWRDWVNHGQLICRGSRTQTRYRLVHRQHPLAAMQGKICRDIDHGVTLHFHDSLLPPAEEVLGAKLILENREHWLRNEATYFSKRGFIFKNPFGSMADGTADATLFRQFGALLCL